jgi:hypothetical protein
MAPGLFRELTPEEEKQLEEEVKQKEEAKKRHGIKDWRHRQKSRKAYSGHKLIFPSTTDSVNTLQHTMVFGSVRSGVLQKLMFINFMICEYRSPLHYELTKIYNDCNLSASAPERLDSKELVHYLKPEHVMKLIGCNRRTAVEYIEVIQSFYSIPMCVSLEVNRRELEKEGKSYYDIYENSPDNTSLARSYPAIEEGEDNNKSPKPLPTWYYSYVMDRSGLDKEEQPEQEEEG